MDGRTDGRTYGQRDIHDKANSRFSQFYELAFKRWGSGGVGGGGGVLENNISWNFQIETFNTTLW